MCSELTGLAATADYMHLYVESSARKLNAPSYEVDDVDNDVNVLVDESTDCSAVPPGLLQAEH